MLHISDEGEKQPPGHASDAIAELQPHNVCKTSCQTGSKPTCRICKLPTVAAYPTSNNRYGTRIKKVNILWAYYTYGYGLTTVMAMGILRLQLWVYDAYGYGHTMLTATGVLGLRLQAYYTYGYGRIAATTTGVLQAYYGHTAGGKLTSGHYSCNCERYIWWLTGRYGLFDASVAKPFLPPFLPCTMTLPRKWRRGSGRAMKGYSDTSAIQTLKAETPRNRSIASAYVRSYTSYANWAKTDTGVPRLRLRAYYCYGYGRSTATGTGVVLLRVRAYYDYGYGRTMTTATGVLRLRLWAYYDYGYGCTTTEATGERTGVLR